MESGKTSRAVFTKPTYTLSSQEVLKTLQTSKEGLASESVEDRKRVYGTNEFEKKDPNPFYKRVFDQLKSPLIAVLVIALLITFVLGEYVDAIVICLALLVAVLLGLYQEERASKAFEVLVSSQKKFVFVIRDGKRHEVNVTDIVPGDIVVLQGGMWVPADLRIIEDKNLSINESALTGEWLAVEKSSESVDEKIALAARSSVAYMGTYVATGHGLGVVTHIAHATELGKLADELTSIENEKTPIQIQMSHVSKLMLWVILVLVVGIFVIGIIRGEELQEMLLTAIAIAVASIPEGLPAAVTIVLAVGMEAVLKKGGLVRNLLAAETLGSTTYILTDKTGTLTQGKMALHDVVYEGCNTGHKDRVCAWEEDEYAKELLDTALCATDAFYDECENSEKAMVSKGDPVERAILEAAYQFGITTQGSSARGSRVDYLAFESENRFAAGLALRGKQHKLCINGAPDLLLEKASKVFIEGKSVKMTSSVKARIEKIINTETASGKRLIAVAYANKKTDSIPEDPKDILTNITFGGVFVFSDPVRSEVGQAVRDVKSAGIKVRLVTGDNAQTALSIANEVGIAKEGEEVIVGSDIETMTDEELLKIVKTSHVFARVLPNQKMRLVKVLQRNQEIVAMTGDGINDAPALRKANIGVSVGSGTEVAKESSDLVLVKDSFATIRFAIEEGRRIVSNLRRIVGYLLSTSLAEVVLIGGAVIVGGPIPLAPAQILWANLIEEGFMSVAFAFEQGAKGAMKRKPRNVHKEGILNKTMIVFVSLISVIVGILLFAMYITMHLMEVPFETMRSLLFLAITVDSLFIAFSFRSLTVPVWRIPLFVNKYFIGSFLLNVALLFIVLSVPVFQNLLSYTPLEAKWFAVAIAYGATTMLATEVAKHFFFQRKS